MAITARTKKQIADGNCYPLGATLTGDGVNFALYTKTAGEVYLLLFDRPDSDPTDIIRLPNRTKFIWHVFVQGLKAGQLYGYKVCGEFDPARGLRFNEHKLLIDPYAKALTGKACNTDNLLLAYDSHSPASDRSLDARENCAIVPKAIVVDDRFDWQGDRPPNIPFENLYIYEVHVKGFTAHRSSNVQHSGTYLGFIEKIPYLKELGIDAVELLPIHEHYDDDFLLAKGLKNYWGYNTLGFFAPELSYSTQQTPGCQVSEFKTLVRELHRAGIEVILDVVYNHSAEGNELGPTLSFRGIDNPTYYCLTGPAAEPQRYYMNYAGCGNSLNFADSQVIRLVMDSLRYWVEVMHVDGFRFDLASVLGRETGSFKGSASFFDVVSQDPVLNRVKLIAEPWDIGSYDVGNFPVDWSEWNGRFRDTVRRFIKGDTGQVRDLGWRLTGSADLYGDDGRSAYNSINFVTCHDGLTLHDLVAYNGKHNEANLEGNRDGSDDNNSWNSGAEGATDNTEVLHLRKQIAKNHICVLFLAMGTPMMLGGDEFLRTQNGNNNAYCQDNEISWFDWNEIERNRDMRSFVQKIIAFTKRYTVLQQRKFVLGQDLDADGVPDFSWFGADRKPPQWHDAECRTLCYRLDGGEVASTIGDYTLLIILNGDHHLQPVQVPAPDGTKRWYRVVDTSLPSGLECLDVGAEILLNPANLYLVNPRSTVVLLAK